LVAAVGVDGAGDKWLHRDSTQANDHPCLETEAGERSAVCACVLRGDFPLNNNMDRWRLSE
jgi:hypothetical protein